MARLHELSDEDLPDVSALIRGCAGRATANTHSSRERPITRKEANNDDRKLSEKPKRPLDSPESSVQQPKICSTLAKEAPKQRRRRPLKDVRGNAVALQSCITNEKVCESSFKLGYTTKRPLERRTPRRRAKRAVNYRESILSVDQNSPVGSAEDESSNSLADFVVDDTESLSPDIESSPADRSLTDVKSGATKHTPKLKASAVDFCNQRPSEVPTPFKGAVNDPSNLAADVTFNDEPVAVLKFSPPRSKCPSKRAISGRPGTPPGDIPRDRIRLGSPTKQGRIPPSPHRPSIDAFWSQEVINEWNDQYSPMKTPRSARRRFILDSDDETTRPASPQKSPGKRDKKAMMAKKEFNQNKHDIASRLLLELDEKVTSGCIGEMTASAGGVKLVWSKKLNSTAGRANWKRETIRQRTSEGVLSTTYGHHASIELAEKVIDDEERLTNVIAHEFCHLANFMISGVKNRPHGKEFKEWADKCSHIFRHRNIEVTTKHTYIIDYKYIWECTKCGTEFKRHSKSIDPARHACGACKSKLVQTQPAPRTAGPSEYQLFVKQRFQALKQAHPSKGQKEVMSMLGAAYKEHKARVGSAVAYPGEIGGLAETIAVDGDSSRSRPGGHVDMDSVSRKLDFLSLET